MVLLTQSIAPTNLDNNLSFEIFNLATHESFVAIAYIISTLVILGLVISIQRDATSQRQLLTELKELEAKLNQNKDENTEID